MHQHWLKQIIASVIASLVLLCAPSFAKKADEKDKKAPAISQATKRAPQPTPEMLEQAIMERIAESLPKTDTAHWPTETSPSGDQTRVILVESPFEGRTERGNLLVLAAPGTYPYQARWYPGLKQRLVTLGWHFMSLGLPLEPSIQKAPNRTSLKKLKDSKTETLQQTYEQELSQAFEKWQSQSTTRGQLLTSFSSANKNASEEVMIAVGKSAYIAGLMAAEANAKLTGLILIDFDGPNTEESEKLNEKLSAQGPILEIIFSDNPSIRRAAQRRLQKAIKAGNEDYRLEFAPRGVHLSHSATPWLAQLIHGWALSNTKP